LLIPGKDKRLLVHKAEPFEIETPLELLRDAATTPVESLFVRNNFQPDWAATLEPPDARRPWQLECVGLLEYPRTIALAEIAALPRIEREMVLQCSGNGRAMFSAAAPVKGSPWRHGAMGNVRFGGVSLRAVFEKFDVHPHAAAKFLTAEGADMPTKSTDADFEHSLPLAEVLDRAMLALELNGKPLAAVHGGPLRLVTPGYYGTMHVKWLTRLRLEPRETVNHHQVKRYRTPLRPIEPGCEFDYGFTNSEPNWNMRIKSVVFAPGDGATLPSGKTSLRGVAWNDGTARIDAVEYSTDGGRQWNRAELQRPTSPYAWHPFETNIDLPPGKHTIVCRAVDTLGRTQPRNGAIDWNPAGYGWHGADAVTVEVA
jgi:DMSO/TMAO reductase YedYZ molybdopterin-dependent catalytic subunit